jgi:hypothetical protein
MKKKREKNAKTKEKKTKHREKPPKNLFITNKTPSLPL